jgi:hypothetical protein
MPYRQNTHFTSPLYPRFKSFLPVAKASFITNQVIKACFEMERENQTKSHHSTWLCLIQIAFQVYEQENLPDFETVH